MTGPDTVAGRVLLVVGLVIVGVCMVLALVVVLAKVVRTRQLRATAERQAPLRPLVLAVAAGEDEDGACADRLAELPRSRRGDARDLLVSMLAKVRGGTADDLVEVLARLRTVEAAEHALGSRSAVSRARAARVLGLMRDQRHTPELVGALADRSPEVRLVAARALGMVGDPSAAGAVLGALAGSGGALGIPASTAAEALIGMGVGTAAALQAGLRSEHAAVRNVAAGVAEVGLFTSTAPRLRVLLASDPDPEVRRTAARALGQLGGREDVSALGRSTERGRPASLRRVATEALGELGDPGAVPVLVGLLADDDRRLAQISADALARLGRRGLEALTSLNDEPTTAGRAARGALAMAQLRAVGRPA